MPDSPHRLPTDALAGLPRPRWVAPTITTGQLFEANSLSCFKAGPTSEECLQNGPFKS